MTDRGSGAIPRGSVASAPLSRHDGLSSCHCAFCHLFPGGPGASGTPVGALRSPHRQASGGDGPPPPALAGGWTSSERTGTLSDGAERK